MMVRQATLEPLTRWDPERIGPYAVLGRLGAGAMGQVYLGRSTAGRLVAVKTIRIEFAEEPGFRARFAREVAAARRVSGVFTAAVVAADPDADVPWLATAYVPAPSLNRLVRACGPLPVRATRWLAAGCAEALESIHGAGLVHRDLKPSNVLVSPDGPRVIDFGVARAAERLQLSVARGAVGSPAYMAPEQARDPREASMASDVFSLGATLVYAATGHPPYEGETVMDILVRLATEPPDLTDLPAELTDLVTACLQRSPRQRPSSAALLTRLGPFMAATDDGSLNRSFLTDSALAVISAYQHSPQETARAVATRPHPAAKEISEDATFGSHTALPAARQRRPRGLAPSRWRTRGPARGGRNVHTPYARWSRLRVVLMATALAAAAVVLVAAGAVVGASLRGPGSQPGDSMDHGGQGHPPGPPPSILPAGRSSRPELRLNQTFGDGNTVFVIHGSGFVPLTQVTVGLAGHGVSPVRPVVDRAGTFNYAIDQGNDFFPGPIPAGTYQVVVTGSGGRKATAQFRVDGPPGLRGPPPPPPTARQITDY